MMNNSNFRRIATVSLFTVFAGLGLTLQAQKLPLDPAVRTGKLPNGFTYYIRHNVKPEKRVVMYLVNKVGSILEDDDQRGLAHFMEHMSFNGTKHFPKNELVNYLQKSGVRFGADLNAYTSFDETVYQLPIPSDKPELLAGGIRIMRDWAQDATLDPEEINKERGVVLEEKRLHKGSGERMQRIYLPLVLNNSRYARRIPIGTDTVLNNFKPEAIKRFYHDWYRPDLQALIVVGDVDVNQMEQTIKDQFGNLKNPAGEKARVAYTVPLTGKNQFVAVTDKEMTTTTAEILIKHPEPTVRTVADYRRKIMLTLFNQMLRARYSELSQQATPPFMSVNAGIGGFIGGLDSYSVSVTARPGELEKGFKALWRETERVKRFGFTSTELDRAKASYLNNLELALSEKDKTNSETYVGDYQANFLKGVAAPGIDAESRLIKRELPRITLQEIGSLTREYITGHNRDILVMAPEKDKNMLPDEATFGNWMNAVAQEHLLPYVDGVSKLPLLAKEPVPGKIISEKKDPVLNLTILTLSNGVKVQLKPTNFGNSSITFRGQAPGGTSLYSDADFYSASRADIFLPACGVGNYTKTQLDKYLVGKEVYVDPYILERSQGINGSAMTKDLETALQLVYAYFTSPRLDTAIFNGGVERTKKGLANRGASPANVFKDTMRAVLTNYSIRRATLTVEKAAQINADRAFTIYKERFADASGFTFTFVGNIDTEKIRPLLEKYLGSLPSSHKNEKPLDIDIHPIEGKVTKIIHMGSEQQASVMLVYSGTFDYSQENKLKLDALKEALEIRLLQRLREEESGVYSPSVMVSNNKYPKSRYQFTIRFSCAPQNADKLITSTLDEVNKLRTQGPPQENVDKWRAETKTSREPELKTNGFWFNYLSNQVENNDELHEIAQYDALLDKISPADLQDMANRYLDGRNFIRLELLPEIGQKQP